MIWPPDFVWMTLGVLLLACAAERVFRSFAHFHEALCQKSYRETEERERKETQQTNDSEDDADWWKRGGKG